MTDIFFYSCDFIFELVKYWLTFRLIEAVAKPRRKVRTERIVQGLTAVVLSGLSIYNISLERYVFSNNIMWFIGFLMLPVVLWLYRIQWFDGSFHICFFWTVLAIIDFFVQSLSFLFLNFLKLDADILMQISWQRGIYLLLFTLAFFRAKNWISRCMTAIYPIKKRWKLLLLGLITPIMIYFQQIYLRILTERYLTSWFFFWMGLALCLAIGAIYIQRTKMQENDKLMNLKMHMLEENYHQAIQMYQEKAALLHDEKNHIRVIHGMLNQGEFGEAIAYTEQIAEELVKSGSRIWSNHPLLDLILNMKYQEAKTQEIEIEIDFDDMSGLILKERDICSLFSNLLDNAIEANQKIAEKEKRWIRMRGERKGNLLFLTITNAVDKKVVLNGKLPVTTKRDKELHGFGMKNIARVVEACEGSMEVEAEEDCFTLSLFLVGFERQK